MTRILKCCLLVLIMGLAVTSCKKEAPILPVSGTGDGTNGNGGDPEIEVITAPTDPTVTPGQPGVGFTTKVTNNTSDTIMVISDWHAFLTAVTITSVTAPGQIVSQVPSSLDDSHGSWSVGVHFAMVPVAPGECVPFTTIFTIPTFYTTGDIILFKSVVGILIGGNITQTFVNESELQIVN